MRDLNFRKPFPVLSYGIVHVTLGVGLFLSLLRVSGSLGLRYDVGNAVSRKISLILISTQIDSNLWLLACSIACLFSVTTMLAARVDRARYCCLLLGNFLAVTLYFLGFEVWGFSLSLIVDLAFLLSALFSKSASLRKTPSIWAFVSLATFLLIIVVVESLALASSLANVFLQAGVLGGVVNLQRELSDLFRIYSPLILVVDLFLWIPVTAIIEKLKVGRRGGKYQADADRWFSYFLLACGVLLACFVAVLPYASGIARSHLYGVDTPYYESYLKGIHTPFEAVAQTVAPRGLYVLLLFGIRSMGLDTFDAIVIVGPSILAVLFTVAIYLLTQTLTENSLVAGIASLYGAISIHTLAGMFAGIFANWLVLSFAMFLIFFLNRLYVSWNWRNLLAVVLMSYLALVAHPWTWAVIILVVLTALLYLYVFDGSSRAKSARIAATFLPLCVLPVILFAVFGGGVVPGLSSVLDAGFGSLVGSRSLVSSADPLQSVMYILRDYVGGFFAYPQTLLLALLGIFSLRRFNRRTSAILISWLAVTSVFSVLASYDFVWRVLYVIPFELLAAVGTLTLLDALDSLSKRAGVKTTVLCIKIVNILIPALLILDYINFVFKSIPFLPIWS